MKSVQSLKVGAAAQILPLAVGYGANLLAAPYFVSQLGIRNFGVWAMTGAIAQYAGLLDLGTSRAANRYVALFHARGDDASDRSVVGICVTAVLALCALLGLFAVVKGDIVEMILRTGDAALTHFLLIAAVVILTCGLLARSLAAASFGRGRQVAANAGLAVLGAAQVLGGVVALMIEPSLRTFAVGTAVGAGTGLVAVLLSIIVDEGRIVIGRPRWPLAREILLFGAKGQAVGAADVVLFQSGKLVAGVILGPAAAGVFELGIRLVQGVQAFGAAASVAITTHLTRAYARDGMEGVLAEYKPLTQRNAAFAIFLPFLLGSTAVSAVPLWLGEKPPGVILVVSVLSAAIATNVSTAVCCASLFAAGRSGVIAATAAVESAITVALAIVLTLQFGFVGLVAAYGVMILCGNVLGVWFLQSRLGISFGVYWRAVRGPFAVALASAAVALPVNLAAAPEDRGSAAAPLLISTALFCAVYLAGAWRLGYFGGDRNRRFQRPNPVRRQTPLSDHESESESPGTVVIIGTRGYPSFYGGFETLVRRLAPHLAANGWDVTVYGRRGAVVEQSSPHHAGVRSVITRGIETCSLSTLSHGVTATLNAARRKPDVALVMNVANGYWLPLLRARGIPTIVNVDGIDWERAKWNALAKRVFKGGAIMTARQADVIVCDSRAIGRFWQENFARASVYIPYGGDIVQRQLDTVGSLVRRRYILLVARLVPENTIGEFLEAAEVLAQEFPVVVVGSFSTPCADEERLRAMCDSLERLTWLGHIADDQLLFDLWCNCGAYFHGHSVGGTNPALVQAMACGAPIVARDTQFNSEVLADAGLYTAPTPLDIVAAVQRVMRSPALQERLSSAARERAKTHFSWDAVCDTYIDVLSAVIRGSLADGDPDMQSSPPHGAVR